MKKFLALLLTLALLAGLTACKDTEAASTAQEQHTVTAPTNDATFVYQPDDPAATLPGGESVVLVTGPGGTESGEDAMLWQGIQTFANTYGYTADAQTAAGNTADEAEAALRAAAESGAKLVVCRGDTMARRSTACRKTTLTSTTCCLTASPTVTIIALTIRPALSIASSFRKNRPGIWPGTPL